MTWENFLNFLFELVSTLGVKILGALITLVVGLKIIRWLKKWIINSPKLNKIDGSVRSFLSSFTGVALYIVLFVTIAMMLGIPTTSFVAALASCFAAIGLAMQGFLSNFAGGLMILLFKPFRVGDYISTPDTEGTVDEITVVYTVLHTVDNKVITIPNGTLTNSVIVNYSAVEKRRVDITFSTGYECDIEKVKAILNEVMEKHPLVIRDPEPFARLSNHGESALEYTIRAWCKSEDYWTVKFDLVESVKKAFDENGITIPFPQVDVHINNPQ